MRLIIFGGPGAGKGTQCAYLTKKYGIPQISTGDILRQAIADKSELGLEAKKFIDEGKLVPDTTIINIIKEKFTGDASTKEGFILDGFPRTLEQAKALDTLLKELGIKLDSVVALDVPDELIIKRISGRRVCKNGHSWHITNNPPKVEGVCDTCGEELFVRSDDKEETIKKRLENYHTQTKPLVGFYSDKGLLHTVDGTKEVEEVRDSIYAVLDK